MDRVSLEQLLSQGLSLAEIGRRFGKHESTVGYWVERYGLAAVNREQCAARGALAREELEGLVESGASIAEIAETVGRGKATVRHWLREYGLTTQRTRRRQASTEGQKHLTLECSHHGTTTFQLRSQGGYRCLKCRSEAVALRRRRVKQILVEEAGGACQVCGYRRCMAALQFHHLEPAQKRFALSHRGVSRSLEKARAEAEKCILLCSNCHAEVEAGIIELA